MIAVPAGAGIFVIFFLLALAVPIAVYALSKRERIGDGGPGRSTRVDRSDAERWARRDGEDTDRDRR